VECGNEIVISWAVLETMMEKYGKIEKTILLLPNPYSYL